VTENRRFSRDVYDAAGVAILRGPRVVLRPARADDIPALEAIRREPSVERWWGVLRDGELAGDLADEEDVEILAIEVDGDVVGAIQWYQEREPAFRHAGMDIFLTTAIQGRGVGTETVRLLARHLVDEHGFHRLVIDPSAANAAAVRAYEKVGFRPVGRLRRSWRGPDGTWEDQLLMDLLADELT
jgi:aminoglycoside 6'-N-acetyltransferase